MDKFDTRFSVVHRIVHLIAPAFAPGGSAKAESNPTSCRSDCGAAHSQAREMVTEATGHWWQRHWPSAGRSVSGATGSRSVGRVASCGLRAGVRLRRCVVVARRLRVSRGVTVCARGCWCARGLRAAKRVGRVSAAYQSAATCELAGPAVGRLSGERDRLLHAGVGGAEISAMRWPLFCQICAKTELQSIHRRHYLDFAPLGPTIGQIKRH